MMAQLGGNLRWLIVFPDAGSSLPLAIIFAEFIFELTDMVVI